METIETILAVKNLSVAFAVDDKEMIAVQNINFTIAKGETLAIVGESGSGKSVSALAIMGLLQMPPAKILEGEIIFNNNSNLLQFSTTQINTIRGNKIAMIFQEPMTSLNPLLKCGQQITESIMLHKKINFEDAKKITLSLLQEVELPNPTIIFEKYPHEISGGQKQRIMIAMALCCEPMLLIADEPTTALDVTVQKSIIELLQKIQQRRGTSILFITHDLGLVRHFAKHTLVLYKGKTIEYNTTEELFSNPQEAYTKALINCKPSVSTRIKYLPTIADFTNSEKPFEAIVENKMEYLASFSTIENKEIILEAKEINVTYNGNKNIFGKAKTTFSALKDINIQVHKNETLGIVGESGCGKSTLAKTFVKLINPTSGTIYFQNKPISDLPKWQYHQAVQMIFQDSFSALNPRMQIGEAILEPMNVYGIFTKNERRKKIEELLEKVGLQAEHYTRYPHEFSGGQRQRICIARALALQPKIIICDESVSALDVSVQAQVLNLLVTLRDEMDLTLLFISHDMSVIKHLCDRVIVMQQGKIVEENNVYSLFDNPQEDYTKKLLSAIPTI